MANKEQDKTSPGRNAVKGDENDNKGYDELKESTDAPDIEEAAADGVQEAQYGKRSYASPDFNKDDDEE
jgi:hypothetical protein